MDFYIAPLFTILIFMTIVFVIAQVLKNNSIVDIFWGLGFVFLSTIYTMNAEPYLQGVRGVVTTATLIHYLIFFWGLRLSFHILIKNWKQPEDWRYVNFRKLWTKKNIPHWLGAFLQVFMLQGFFMFIIALPIIHSNQYFTPISNITYIGIFIWLIGFFFEAIGDYQKSQFKKNPANKDKILTTGLWKYTRHPNYFGECVMWWAIFLISINIFHPITTLVNLISPITLTWLLTKVSGVPMLESKYKTNDAYQTYIQKTPSFFPKFW